MPQNLLFFTRKNTRKKCDQVKVKMKVKVKVVNPNFVKIIDVMARITFRTVLLLQIQIFYVKLSLLVDG
jgi:hypothetical protein